MPEHDARNLHALAALARCRQALHRGVARSAPVTSTGSKSPTCTRRSASGVEAWSAASMTSARLPPKRSGAAGPEFGQQATHPGVASGATSQRIRAALDQRLRQRHVAPARERHVDERQRQRRSARSRLARRPRPPAPAPRRDRRDAARPSPARPRRAARRGRGPSRCHRPARRRASAAQADIGHASAPAPARSRGAWPRRRRSRDALVSRSRGHDRATIASKPSADTGVSSRAIRAGVARRTLNPIQPARSTPSEAGASAST